jgi:Calponin homology (CH) domain
VSGAGVTHLVPPFYVATRNFCADWGPVVLGTSVEDLLEGPVAKPSPNRPSKPPPPIKKEAQITLDEIFSPPPPPPNANDHNKLNIEKRKELIDTHIRKPVVSIRRVKQLCQWINAMHIWPTPITILTLHDDVCSGLLLIKLMEQLVPVTNFIHVNKRALTQKAALENIEQFIGLLRRSKAVNFKRIPDPMEIYTGNTSKIAVLLQEVFDIYMRKPLYAKIVEQLTWYHAVLRQYDRPLPTSVFSDRDLVDVWSHFQSGVALFCIVYHFCGPTTIGEGKQTFCPSHPLTFAAGDSCLLVEWHVHGKRASFVVISTDLSTNSAFSVDFA